MSQDLNHVMLIGRLTRDAELKYTQNGFAISNFSIAVNRRKKDGDNWVDEVSFFEVNLFGKQAEAIQQYMLKGKQIAVDGELRQDRWNDESGNARSKVITVANNVQLLGGGDQKPQQQAPQQNGYNSGYNQGNTGGYNPNVPVTSSGDDFPEDIPF